MEEKTYPVRGMSCASCAAHVTKALQRVEGVKEVSVNLATAKARIIYDAANPSATPEAMARAVQAVGFELVITEEQAASSNEPSADKAPAATDELTAYRQTRRRALGSACIAVLLLLLGMGFPHLFKGENWLLLALAAFSMLRYGREFYVNAWQLLKHGTASMDTLVALSTGVAFGVSCCALIFPAFFHRNGLATNLYFDSVGVVTACILLGRWLEARARRRTTQVIRSLISLRPEEASVLLPDGTERREKISALRPGDTVLVRPGERIAVDGVVIRGNSYVDESSLNGEPLPVLKVAGSLIMAGTINQSGTLTFRAQRVGSDTLLSRVVQMVEEAVGSRVPVQSLVDKIAAVFVPIVIGISILAFTGWCVWGAEGSGLAHGLLAFVSVLVVACPCSLGLATPTALIVGTSRAARAGVLVRDATALEKGKRVSTVIFDKTGTLTLGRPEVIGAYFSDEEDGEAGHAAHSLRSILHTLEHFSSHPLATAVCKYLASAPLQDAECSTLSGRGVRGEIAGQTFFAGSLTWMQELGKKLSADQTKLLQEAEQQAHTCILLASESSAEVLALLTLADALRPEATACLSELHMMGIQTILLTGDGQRPAEAVRRLSGAGCAIAGVMPDGKANIVKELQARGECVAMVGDGINDSAALARADLSIALGTGSDIALQAAQVTLLRPDLTCIPLTLRLSRQTIRTIKENLFWAFFYNTVSIPIAAGALYPFCGFMLSPMVAGLAMALSSLSVMGNSLRLYLMRSGGKAAN